MIFFELNSCEANKSKNKIKCTEYIFSPIRYKIYMINYNICSYASLFTDKPPEMYVFLYIYIYI